MTPEPIPTPAAESVSRRQAIGTFGAMVAASVCATGTTAAASSNPTGAVAGTLRERIARLVEQTPFVDTHEHLWEEGTRLAGKATPRPRVPPPDFSMLLSHYTHSDLRVAGLSEADYQKVVGWDLTPREKWKLVAPYYERCRHTGYQLGVRESVRLLYGENDLRAENVDAISAKLAADVQPGFYRRILQDVARVERAQVNNLENMVFNVTAQPDLLAQDLSTVALCWAAPIPEFSKLSGIEVRTLEDWHRVIDWCFAKYGPLAIATKNQEAYTRRLDYDDVPADAVASFLPRLVQGQKLSAPEVKTLQDHLFNYCVRKAAEAQLPVKLHTGYYWNWDAMPLERLRQNAGDLCPVFMRHPNAKFVVMHIGYPYQDETIALAKHFTNVTIDMCWAWIINPAACVRFVKEFLMAAPATKLLTFGGDFLPVELVPGHAAMARRGIAQAISELIEERWLAEDDAPALIERIMRGNANELFDHARTLRNWGKA